MKAACKILVFEALIGLVFGGALLAGEEDRNGIVRGIFIRAVEREAGERVYMGIVVKPFERDEPITILVPRRAEELGEVVRSLREGQEITIAFVREDGQMWVREMEAERREVVEERPGGERRVNVRREVLRFDEDVRERRGPERPLEHLEQVQRELREIIGGHFERLAGEFRELMAHVEGLERELRELREENERLRMELRGRGSREREREREAEERREGREREERERQRERDEGRATRERPQSEREVVLHQLEVMRLALPALREAERGDAAELLTLAIRAREMMLERRRDEEAQRVRERAPNREQLIEILSMAAELWREFGNADKSAAIRELAEQLSGAERRQVRQREEREIRIQIERRREGREREGRERRREVEEQSQIRERERRDRPREREEVREAEPSLPDGMTGFRGMLIGRLLRKLDRGFVLKVERVTKIWETNRADKPEAAVGKDLIITIPADEEIGRPFLRTLRALKIGEPVLVEAFHFEGNRLTVVEQLRRYE
jgi:regulator of replication initiation timing